MDKNFARDIEYHKSVADTKMMQFYHNRLIEYLEELLESMFSGHLPYILDIGECNPLTKKLENHFNTLIGSTISDLDESLDCLDKMGSPIIDNNPSLRFHKHTIYDIVIFNHVIEHLFNPLFCLENIKDVMHSESILIIGTPIKPNFITTSTGHFHEMDEYRFKKLIARAGLKIIDWKKFHIYNHISWRNFIGLRPFLMMFYKCHSIIKCIKS